MYAPMFQAGVPRGVDEELVVAAITVDDLRDYCHEHEGVDEVGDLVVERDRLEEVPQEAGTVQDDADHDEGHRPRTWH